MASQKSSFPKVAIIIVSWNGRKFLEISLPSIKKLLFPKNKLKIILVDNGSVDGSEAWVRKNFPDIYLVKNKKNLGFAKSNNQGIVKAMKDKKIKYLVTLNNDVEVDKKWLINLVSFMEKEKAVGICASKILNFYNHKVIDSCGDFFAKGSLRVVNRGRNQKDRRQFDKPEEVLSACAAASIFRRETLEALKDSKEYFDEDFFNYIEDVDLNIRARFMGWSVFYNPEARIFHIGSGTTSKISKIYKEYVSRRNRIFMAIKNFPTGIALLLVFKYTFPSKIGINYYLTRVIKPKIKKGFAHYRKKGFIFYLTLFIDRYIISGDSERLSPLEAFWVQVRAIASTLPYLPKMMVKRKVILKKSVVSSQEIKRWMDKLAIRN